MYLTCWPCSPKSTTISRNYSLLRVTHDAWYAHVSTYYNITHYKIHELFILLPIRYIRTAEVQAVPSNVLCCRPETDINYIYDSFIDEHTPAKGIIVVRSHGRFEKQTHRSSRQIKISLLSVPRPCAAMNYSARRQLRHLYNNI